MAIWSLRLSTHLVALAIGATFVVSTIGLQPTSAQERLALTTNEFLANPSLLLEQDPNGRIRLAATVREFAVADTATLQGILGLLANANKDQKIAIGRGLAQAARIVVRTNPTYANHIQEAVAQTKDQDLVLAYTVTSGDTQLGGIGGGFGGGGGGAVGGQTNPLPAGATSAGGIQPIGGPGTRTGLFSITSSVAGSSAGGQTSTISQSVSP
jgi:hypothetical protein